MHACSSAIILVRLRQSDLYLDAQVFSNKDVFRAILYADLDFDSEPWPHLSPGACDFVASLLTRDPAARPTAAEVCAAATTRRRIRTFGAGPVGGAWTLLHTGPLRRTAAVHAQINCSAAAAAGLRLYHLASRLLTPWECEWGEVELSRHQDVRAAGAAASLAVRARERE